jgi:hypothetical protein
VESGDQLRRAGGLTPRSEIARTSPIGALALVGDASFRPDAPFAERLSG